MGRADTEVERWTAEALVRAASPDGDANGKRHIEIPKFQRSIVWSRIQKESLISSIVEGLPIGAFLLYRAGTGSKEGMTRYLLIDGLQRCTALREHIKCPTRAFSPDQLSNDLIVAIQTVLKLDNSDSNDRIRSEVTSWVRSKNGWGSAHGCTSLELADHIVRELGPELKPARANAARLKIASAAEPTLESIQTAYDISLQQLPVIIYSGSEANLPTIFERLNSSGTQLNKYQIFAATWLTYPARTENRPDLVGFVVAKYQSLVDQGYEIENFDPLKPFDELSFFELLFAFGKNLTDRFPLLYRVSERKPDEVDSIGFNLAGLASGCSLKELAKLPLTVTDEGFDSMRAGLEESSSIVDGILAPVLKLKANQDQKKNAQPRAKFHTELQISSIVASQFRKRYRLDKNQWVKRIGKDNSGSRLSKALPARYLVDLLSSYWSGTGDAKAMQGIAGDRAFQNVSKSQIKAELAGWIEQQLLRTDKNRKVALETELFLRFVYAKTWNAATHLDGSLTFDFEHIFPVKRLRDVMNENDAGRPINALGNMCLLQSSANKAKKSSTYFEYLDDCVEKKKLDMEEKQKIENRFRKESLVSRQDLKPLLEAELRGDTEAFWQEYEAFAARRAKKLVERFLKFYFGDSK